MTVGVISAQKKMLSVLTAWEENMPMMENATENFRFRVSRRTERKERGESGLAKVCADGGSGGCGALTCVVAEAVFPDHWIPAASVEERRRRHISQPPRLAS